MYLTRHALEQYSLRKYNDLSHYLFEPVREELKKRLQDARPSRYNPRRFFKGREGIKARDVFLLQDDLFIYAIRDGRLITVINVPGTDFISDAFGSR